MRESNLGLLHHNYDKRNQILYWAGTDQKDRFEANCRDPVNRQKLQDLGWLDPNPELILYKYNSFGFRDEEFDDRACGLALGCSHTEGTGLPEDKIWARLLSKLIGTHIWNLGVGGSSLDTAYRLLDYWLPTLKPKFIVCCVPDQFRLEVFDCGNPASIVPHHQLPQLQNFYKVWTDDDTNAKILKRKNLLAMQQICDQADIPFYYIDCQELGTKDHTRWPPGSARDLMHCGVELHEIFAQKMYNFINLGEFKC